MVLKARPLSQCHNERERPKRPIVQGNANCTS